MNSANARVLLVIPAYNEEQLLADTCIRTLKAIRNLVGRFDVHLLVCDNNSTDGTAGIIRNFPEIMYRREPIQGKGGAILGAWAAHRTEYDIFAFMDADLAVDLAALEPLLDAVRRGSAVANGSRYAPGARVERSTGRMWTSAVYRALLRWCLGLHVKDVPCGFKAVSKEVVEHIVPHVRQRGWFFDAELLLRVQNDGLKITELPVQWREPRDGENQSRVVPVKVFFSYLKALIALRKIR